MLSASTSNGNIDVTTAGDLYLADQTSSKGSTTAAISTSTSATVTLDAGNIYNPNTNAKVATVVAGTLVLTANEAGTASDPLETSVTSLTVDNGVAGGLFLSNNTSLTVTEDIDGSGDVSISTEGDLALDGSISGINVTLTATGGGLTSTSTTTAGTPPVVTGIPPVITATGTLTLSAEQIGDSSAYSPDGSADAATEVLQTDATTINAEADYGGISISNDSTAALTLTAGAVGPESDDLPTNNIEIYSAGSIIIDPQTTTLTALNGSQAVGVFNLGGTATLVAGATLSYDGSTTTPGVSNSTITSAATTGSGAQVSFTAAGGIITSVVSAPVAGGSGYPESSTFDLTVTGGGGSGGVVQATTNSDGVVTSFSLVAGGSGYTTTTGAATSQNAVVATTGSGAQVSFTAVGGVITSVDSTPAAKGSGYPDSSTFDLMVTGGGGSGGVVQATTNANGVVTSFGLVAGGSGYTTLTTANTATYDDVVTGTLYIDGSTTPVPTSTAATGTDYGPLVVETNTSASSATGSQTSTAPLELTAGELSGGGTFTAPSIIIDNLGVNGQPGVLTISSSLTLDATDGSVVFLNPNDTIDVTGTITVYAGTTSTNGTISSTNSAATSNDVTVLGNLETSGGNISISAVGNVMIGTINAGSGQVFLTSITGSILSSTGTALAITGATILKSAPQSASGSQSASLVQLNATQAIAAATQAVAAYDAAVAEEAADSATAAALQAELTSIDTAVTDDTTTYDSDVKATDQATSVANAELSVVNQLTTDINDINESAATTALAGDVLIVAGTPLLSNVFSAPAGAVLNESGAVLEVAAGTLSESAASLTLELQTDSNTLSNDASTEASDQSAQDVAQAQLQADTDTQTAVLLAYTSVESAHTSAEAAVAADAVIVTAAQEASAQATAAVVGTATPLPLTVAGPVNISDASSGASSGASSAGIVVNTPITVAEPASGAEVSVHCSGWGYHVGDSYACGRRQRLPGQLDLRPHGHAHGCFRRRGASHDECRRRRYLICRDAHFGRQRVHHLHHPHRSDRGRCDNGQRGSGVVHRGEWGYHVGGFYARGRWQWLPGQLDLRPHGHGWGWFRRRGAGHDECRRCRYFVRPPCGRQRVQCGDRRLSYGQRGSGVVRRGGRSYHVGESCARGRRQRLPGQLDLRPHGHGWGWFRRRGASHDQFRRRRYFVQPRCRSRR